jgi:hypothetical protein
MASQLAPQAAGPSGSAEIDALWLDTLQRVCGRAAHDLKGVLNGVSVNLEVVRSRAEKPDTPASAVSRFANAAADQLGAVIAMNDALLALARPAPEPVEIDGLVRRLEALLAPAVRTEGRSLVLDDSLGFLGPTSGPASVVRLAVAASLLSALDASAHVVCRAHNADGEPTLVIECRDGAAVSLVDAVANAATDAGIRMTAEPSAISISFPR